MSKFGTGLQGQTDIPIDFIRADPKGNRQERRKAAALKRGIQKAKATKRKRK